MKVYISSDGSLFLPVRITGDKWSFTCPRVWSGEQLVQLVGNPACSSFESVREHLEDNFGPGQWTQVDLQTTKTYCVKKMTLEGASAPEEPCS